MAYRGVWGAAVREEFIKREDLTFHLMPQGQKRKRTLKHAAGDEKERTERGCRKSGASRCWQ